MTREHVWPKWVLDLFAGEDLGGMVWAANLRVKRAVRGMAELTVKRVCERCNTGWMAALEDKAKPILSPPILGERQVFGPGQARIAATWGFKTALIADLAHTEVPAAPPEVYRYFGQRKRPPTSVLVTASRYAGERYPLYAGSHVITFDVEQPFAERATHDAYLLTVSAGHLTLQVFGHHLPQFVDLKPKDWKRDLTILVWPEPDPSVWPPVSSLTDETLSRFARTL